MMASMRPGFMASSGGSRGVSTVEIAPPDPTGTAVPQATLRTQAGTEFSNLARGRVSLLALNSLMIVLIAYYLWTRSAQGS